jgi:hypothetical protein
MFVDSTGDRSIRYNIDHAVILANGMAQLDSHERLHWELLLCCWYWNGCFCSMGARTWQQLRVYRSISIWAVLWRVWGDHHSSIWGQGELWRRSCELQ